MTELRSSASPAAIRRTEYAPFTSLKHLFLVGDLQRDNPHPFVRDARLEVIACFYQPGDNGRPHWHRDVTEYEMVIEGEVGHFDVVTGETHWFGPGDLRILPPGVCTRRILRVPTRTLAIKVPSSSEKVHCAECSRECESRLEDQCVSR
jgi:hypothetical protein